jgi:hypothetical protein
MIILFINADLNILFFFESKLLVECGRNVKQRDIKNSESTLSNAFRITFGVNETYFLSHQSLVAPLSGPPNKVTALATPAALLVYSLVT